MRLEEQVMGDEAAWQQLAQDIGNELLEDERAALRRVAQGTATWHDAALLARSLGHNELFTEAR
jgi:hypothetical protein